mmetsp:Transcript_35779/g.54810  ORF Transcript_35779/g.54810 Transcript_35779/m.54810 type:complete len:82 (-) Transcript_35779:87-332(-)
MGAEEVGSGGSQLNGNDLSLNNGANSPSSILGKRKFESANNLASPGMARSENKRRKESDLVKKKAKDAHFQSSLLKMAFNN